jgi:hypothetical protein
MDTVLAGTMSTAEQRIRALHAMTNDPAAAVRAGGGQRVDRALEAVEHVQFPTHPHFEAFVVCIATYLACGFLISEHTFRFVHNILFPVSSFVWRIAPS